MTKIIKTAIATTLLGLSSISFAEQECNASIEQSTPNTRYELSSDEVKDKRTNLVWKRCMLGQSWNAESSTCDGDPVTRNWLEAHEQTPAGWRLPNINELLSIVEYSCANPTINLTIFPTTPVGTFWSSTLSKSIHYAFSGLNQRSWTLNLQDGATGYGSRDRSNLIRFVKDAS